MNLSVLISAYINCSESYIKQALKSIYEDQFLKPNQIVIVLDGPVKSNLLNFVLTFKQECPCEVIVHRIKKSQGFGNALNQGLKLCKGKYIARMDTDDIALPDRFSSQIEFLEKNPDIDVLGTWISEINELNKVTRDEVRYPITNEECFEFFAKRDPVAHPSVIFRESYFAKAGLYSIEAHLFEDTVMWHQGFKTGCRFYNLPKVCLKYRRSEDFFTRRSNIRANFELLKYRFRNINKDLNFGAKGNFFAVLYFFMQFNPSFVRRFLYKKFR